MRFDRVLLEAPPAALPKLDGFYAGRLGLERHEESGLKVGESKLAFVAGSGEPFYHFALLVPGNRFEAAFDWIGERVELLPGANGEVVFDFDNWDALACYFHDAAGNIVELIAHRGIEESIADGPFTAQELVGLSELGLVGDKAVLAGRLRRGLGLEQWDGDLAGEGTLAFVGEKARTFILSPAGRGWLPTGRPAEAHACEVESHGSGVFRA
jgi:catechol 2,3-dioxygenase-like lactoylglutathione lyase family enzyme